MAKAVGLSPTAFCIMGSGSRKRRLSEETAFIENGFYRKGLDVNELLKGGLFEMVIASLRRST
jgi:hypothetical protein